MSSRYMMATKATHTLGDISRDEPDLAIIDREVGDDYIGEWVTGIGYVGVRFPKATTRALTEDEKAYYRTKVVETPWGSWSIDPDEPPGYAGDVLKDTWQGEPRPTVEPVTVKLDNRDATFTPTGPAHFPAQPATAAVGASEPAGETTGQDETWQRALGVMERSLDKVSAKRAEAEAERDRLRDENVHLHVQLARIRALHRQYRDVYATDETGDSCAHCNTFTDAWRVPWPCPTIQALDDPVFPAPDKETEPGYRPVLLDISRDETRHPRDADGRWEHKP